MSYPDPLFVRIEQDLDLVGEVVLSEAEWETLYSTMKRHLALWDAWENEAMVKKAEEALGWFDLGYNQKV